MRKSKMLKKRLKELLLAVALLPLLVQPALAHVVWFDSKDGGYELLFGHPEEGPEPYDVAKFQSATAYDINKQVVPIKINRQDRISVVPQGDIAALTALYDNGFWLRNPEDSSSRNISPEEAEAINYVNVTNFVKYTKALYDWSEAISQPFGIPLEIVPLKNPFEIIVGETLPIQVLFEGSLIKDALVEYLGETLDVNEQGITYIPIGEGGLQVIEASYTSPRANNPGISYATTFTAERTSVPEPSVLLGLSVLGLMAFARKQGQGLKLTKPATTSAKKA
jgi:nickel transport protein